MMKKKIKMHQTEEKPPPPPIRRKENGTHYKEEKEEGGGGDLIECSGKYCGSCAAGLIADCVALCCCPCGLVNILAFAFVKVPWMVGRKCLGRLKKRRIKRKKEKMLTGRGSGGGGGGAAEEEEEEEEERDRDGNMRKRRVEDGNINNNNNNVELGDDEFNMGGFEAERVWFELYKDGHLGFGRVSFTGIQFNDHIFI